MKLYDHVKIKSSGITGVIVDIFGERFTVESDTERVPGDTSGYPVAIVHLPGLRIGTAEIS